MSTEQVEQVEQVNENEMTLEKIQVFMKTMKSADLVALMNSAFSILAKQAKAMETQAEKKKTARKNPNQGKQLQKPRAWVNYVHKYAQVNGWESFIVEKDGEEIVMPGSMEHNGAHVFENSITEKKPEGQKLILKDAMSLSKVYRNSKPELYAEFEAQYQEIPSEVVVAEKAEKPKVVVRKTAAEKEAEKAAKLAEKEAEKDAKKAQKEAEKEAKKAEKEAEKAAKKAEKEAEKEAKKAEKKASPKSSPKASAVIPKEATVPVASKAATAATSMDTPKLKGKKSEEEWVAPPAGKCAPFTFKGKKYIRSSDNEMWAQGADGGAGDWVGMFDPKTNKIDTSVADPYADDSDDE